MPISKHYRVSDEKIELARRAMRRHAEVARKTTPGVLIGTTYTDRQLLELGCHLVAEFFDEHTNKMREAHGTDG